MRFSTAILYAYISDDTFPFRQLICEEEMKRRDQRYPCTAVKPYFYSSFKYLFLSKNDQALINATGHDHKSFHSLLLLFYPYYMYWTVDICTGKIRKKVLYRNGEPMGRQRDMSAIGCLGLILMWCQTRGSSARGLTLMF